MSSNANEPNVSAPVADEATDLQKLIHAIAAAAGPGIIKSAMIANDLYDPQISGVVFDADEPGGGYVAAQELAQGTTYILLGVGKLGVGKLPPGITIANRWLPKGAG